MKSVKKLKNTILDIALIAFIIDFVLLWGVNAIWNYFHMHSENPFFNSEPLIFTLLSRLMEESIPGFIFLIFILSIEGIKNSLVRIGLRILTVFILFCYALLNLGATLMFGGCFDACIDNRELANIIFLIFSIIYFFAALAALIIPTITFIKRKKATNKK